MFIDHTFLFGCMAWWVRTCVLTEVGWFVTDNAYNNDTAIQALASQLNFVTAERRLRCGSHTINTFG
jgi:hypothetical protein